MRFSWGVTVSALVATGLGAWFALAVPLGLPYDEPSHWATVQWYASEHRLPVLGEPGVTYEARMGPVYYTVAALVVAAAGGAGQPHAPTILRLVGVVLLPMLVLLTYRVGRLLSAPAQVSASASALVATTPLLLMVGGSIQNDLLCFVLAALALVVGMRLLGREDVSWAAHLGLGALVGLAILTKVVALALLPALAVGYLAHRAPLRRRVAWAAGAAVGAVGTSGWWLVRNWALYGDPSGTRAAARVGITFPPTRWTGLGDATAWFGNLVSYVYLPVEYYRNLLRSPAPLRIAAIALALATVAVVVLNTARSHPPVASRLGSPAAPGRHLDPVAIFVVATLVFAVVSWVASSFLVADAAPRLAFHAAPVVAVLFAAATRRRPWTWLAGATVVAFLAADVWLVSAAPKVSGFPFLFG